MNGERIIQFNDLACERFLKEHLFIYFKIVTFYLWTVLNSFVKTTYEISSKPASLIMSPNRRGGGYIAFGAGPVGVGVRVASCHHSVGGFRPNFHRHIIGRGKEVIRFW